jgi:hypothetical protein
MQTIVEVRVGRKIVRKGVIGRAGYVPGPVVPQRAEEKRVEGMQLLPVSETVPTTQLNGSAARPVRKIYQTRVDGFGGKPKSVIPGAKTPAHNKRNRELAAARRRRQLSNRWWMSFGEESEDTSLTSQEPWRRYQDPRGRTHKK